ncbi:MAG: nicotinamide-nucleotide adenylyltransferase [Patescibacteria group bacterium]
MPSALLIGRFQPFHLGHLDALNKALIENDRVLIGIGSAEDNYTDDNPFTAGERFEMIEKTLQAHEIAPGRYAIIPIRNINNYSLWASHVKLLCPSFESLYTGSHMVKELFQKHAPDIEIKDIEIKHKICATAIREKILQGDESWAKMVPEQVAQYLTKIKVAERLRDIQLPRK